MRFEWDERKRRQNLAKHGMDFDLARRVFAGHRIEREDRRRDYGEERVLAYAEVDGIVLCLTYTWRGEVRRIISLRRARRDERKSYYAETSEGGNP